MACSMQTRMLMFVSGRAAQAEEALHALFATCCCSGSYHDRAWRQWRHGEAARSSLSDKIIGTPVRSKAGVWRGVQ